MKHPRWRPVPGFPGYEVSETGRIRRVGGGRKYLRQTPCGRNGIYLKVHITRAGRNIMVNRLVCEAFHGPPPGPGYHADHVDRNPRRNHADNLRWLPSSVNLGRRIVWTSNGWRKMYEAEEEPEGLVPLTPEENAEIDEHLAAPGW